MPAFWLNSATALIVLAPLSFVCHLCCLIVLGKTLDEKMDSYCEYENNSDRSIFEL